MPCAFSLVPASAQIPANGGSFSTDLSVTGVCPGSWTASSDETWISSISPTSGTTAATITYVVLPNPGTTERRAHITFEGSGGRATLTVTQSGTACSYALSSTTQVVPIAGGAFSTALAASCAWTASSDVPWIGITPPTSGTATATVAYTVQANTGASRTGHVTVQGSGGGSAQLSVIQTGISGQPCTYTLNPTTQPVQAAGGGPFTTAVTTSCSWTASSDSWITMTSATSGTTNGTIVYTVQANTGPARFGRITLQGEGGTATLTVSQDAAQCTYALNPTSQPVVAGGSSFNTALVVAASCSGSWTASSDVPWITNISPGSGTTSATIAYTVQVNSGAARTGHVIVQGAGGTATLTVSQDAAACSYQLSPSTQVVPASVGGPFNTALVVAASCSGSWTASSDVIWITNISPPSGTSSATIAYLVQGNSGPVRTGRVTVQGPGGISATLTVTQDPAGGATGAARLADRVR